MTVTENGVEATSVAGVEPTPAPEPTYFDLVKSVWLLAWDLSPYGEQDTFCEDGVNQFLADLGLPKLIEDADQAESYLRAWFGWQAWNHSAAGEISPEDNAGLRSDLAGRLRRKLEHDEPKSRETMNGWLTQLGLDGITPPPPVRHTGRYDVSFNASNRVNSALIQEAVRAALGEDLDVRVTYVGRIA